MSLSDSISVPPELHSQISELARMAGKSEAELVRDAIAVYTANGTKRPSVYDVAKKAGWFEPAGGTGLPSDLATNPAHLEAFGRG